MSVKSFTWLTYCEKQECLKSFRSSHRVIYLQAWNLISIIPCHIFIITENDFPKRFLLTFLLMCCCLLGVTSWKRMKFDLCLLRFYACLCFEQCKKFILLENVVCCGRCGTFKLTMELHSSHEEAFMLALCHYRIMAIKKFLNASE